MRSSEFTRHPKSSENQPAFPAFGVWLENLFNFTSTQIEELTQSWNNLYTTISELQAKEAARKLNLAEKDDLAELSKRYWQIGKQLNALKQELAQFEDEWLIYSETGDIKPERQHQYDTTIAEFAASQKPKTSRTRMHREEEIVRTGSDPRNSPDPLVPVGDGYYRLTTGHNRTDLKSSRGVAPADAESVFRDLTIDSHGGKRRPKGKRPNR